jgi:hypothetical protein
VAQKLAYRYGEGDHDDRSGTDINIIPNTNIYSPGGMYPRPNLTAPQTRTTHHMSLITDNKFQKSTTTWQSSHSFAPRETKSKMKERAGYVSNRNETDEAVEHLSNMLNNSKEIDRDKKVKLHPSTLPRLSLPTQIAPSHSGYSA